MIEEIGQVTGVAGAEIGAVGLAGELGEVGPASGRRLTGDQPLGRPPVDEIGEERGPEASQGRVRCWWR